MERKERKASKATVDEKTEKGRHVVESRRRKETEEPETMPERRSKRDRGGTERTVRPQVTAGAVTNKHRVPRVVSRVSVVRKLAQTRLFRSRGDESSRNDVGDAGQGHVRTYKAKSGAGKETKRTKERTKKKEKKDSGGKTEVKKKGEREIDVTD